MANVLHVVDPTTPDFALRQLGYLWSRGVIGGARTGAFTPHVMVLGDHALREALAAYGVQKEAVGYRHAAGWFDPSLWRWARQTLGSLTTFHAWGYWGAVAGAAAGGGTVRRVQTVLREPSRGQLRLLRLIAERCPWTVIAGSGTVRRRLLRGGVRDESVVQIRPGVSLEAIPETRAALREAWGMPDGAVPVIAVGGSMEYAARADVALWAAAVLVQMYPGLRVLLRPGTRPGEKTWEANLRGVAAGVLPAAVTWAPSGSSWGQVVRAADVLLVTVEGGTDLDAVFAAMAAGTPVVATATQGISELVEHDYTGLLSPVGQVKPMVKRVNDLWNNVALRARLTDHARAQLFGQFSISAMAQAYRELYASDLSGKTPTPPPPQST